MSMKSSRYILQSFNVLNLLLLAAAVGCYLLFLAPLLATPTSADVPQPRDTAPALPADRDAEAKAPPTDYALLAEQNLFHPDRTLPEGKKPPASPQPRPELVLHGTMITGELKIAYLTDKKGAQKAPGRSAPHIIVKEGDNVSGYTLKQITENMILLVNGEEQITLYLDEIKDRKGEITGPARAPSQPTAPPPMGAPVPSMRQPAQIRSAGQSAPSMSPPQPVMSTAQPGSPTAPTGEPRQPAMPYFPLAPSVPVPPQPVMQRR